MSGTRASKADQQREQGQLHHPTRELSPQLLMPDAYADMLALQQSAGNQAVNTLMQGSIPPLVQSVLNSVGQPLEPRTRAQMESRFGEDFSRVRVHTDTPAAESAYGVSAQAYTLGNNVVFARNRYAPDTTPGKRLLAHELAHVVQQSRGGVAPAVDLNSSLEQAADQAALGVVHSEGLVQVSGASAEGIARQPAEPADLPVLLSADVDVTKLTPMQRRQFIESIQKRLQYLDSLAKKASQPGFELKIPGAQPFNPETERARLFDWKKKLEEGTGIIVAPGIPRSSTAPTPAAQASTQTGGEGQSQVGKKTDKPQDHTTPPGLGPKSGVHSLDDTITASNVRPGSVPPKGNAAAFGGFPPLSDEAVKAAVQPGGGAKPEEKKPDKPQAHSTPPGLGPKPGPHSLDDTITASNVRPGSAPTQNKPADLTQTTPPDAAAIKRFAAPRRPGEVTLPDGQTVVIPPKPPEEITVDIETEGMVLAKANVKGVRATIVHNLRLDFDSLEYGATQGKWAAQTFLDKWTVRWIVRKPSDIVSGAKPPEISIWTNVDKIIKQGSDAIRAGNLEEAIRLLVQGQEELRKARRTWYDYTEKNLGGAENIATGLEVTRDVSFGTLAVLATIASGGATAGAANAIAFGAPLVAEGAVTALQVAAGDTIKWDEKVASIAVSLLVQRYGGPASKSIVSRVMTSNPAARSLGEKVVEEIVQNLILHQGSVALNTAAQAVVTSAHGKPMTWDQFETQLIDNLSAPQGLAVAAVTAAITGGAKSVYSARGGKETKVPPGKPPESESTTTAKEPSKGTAKAEITIDTDTSRPSEPTLASQAATAKTTEPLPIVAGKTRNSVVEEGLPAKTTPRKADVRTPAQQASREGAERLGEAGLKDVPGAGAKSAETPAAAKSSVTTAATKAAENPKATKVAETPSSPAGGKKPLSGTSQAAAKPPSGGATAIDKEGSGAGAKPTDLGSKDALMTGAEPGSKAPTPSSVAPAEVGEAAFKARMIREVENVMRANRRNTIGSGGEAGAQASARTTSMDLNAIKPNFPQLDTLSREATASVKAFGVDKPLTASVIARYDKELQALRSVVEPGVPTKLGKAADLIASNREAIQAAGAWPRGLARNATPEQVAKFVNQQGVIAIPADHVDSVRAAVAANARANPEAYGLTPGAGLDKGIERLTARVQSLGLTAAEIVTINKRVWGP